MLKSYGEGGGDDDVQTSVSISLSTLKIPQGHAFVKISLIKWFLKIQFTKKKNIPYYLYLTKRRIEDNQKRWSLISACVHKDVSIKITLLCVEQFLLPIKNEGYLIKSSANLFFRLFRIASVWSKWKVNVWLQIGKFQNLS